MPSLSWIGKDKVLNHHNEVPYRVLEKKYSYGDENAESMIIHGDNLLALKSLLPKFEGKIKCIYIDPPYNTAKSSEANKQWVYSDNVDSPQIKAWLDKVVGDEGDDLCRHDKWLCMMYPRLRLLYKLLANDGIMFISIDDNEQHYLRIICDEIFGKNSFLTQFVWRSDGNFDNQAKVKVCHEYILTYIKKTELIGLPHGIDPNVSDDSKIFKAEVRNTVVKNGPKNPMSQIVIKAGFPCAMETGVISARKDKFPYYYDDLIIKDHKLQKDVIAESGWSSKTILENFINSDFNEVLDSKNQRTIFEITQSGTIEMIKKRDNISHVMSVLSNLGSTQNMSNELTRMGLKFDFPKPVDLIAYLINFYCTDNDIILDSFAGSGTTAHAVLNLNKLDGKNRKFILIEMLDYVESITSQRVRCIIDGYGEGNAKKEGTGGGFSYYELGAPLMKDGESLNPDIDIEIIREYIWYMETRSAYEKVESADNQYFLGVHNDTAYYFNYEREMQTVLDNDFLRTVKTKTDAYVIYADICNLSDEKMRKYNITFKKIPRDIARL